VVYHRPSISGLLAYSGVLVITFYSFRLPCMDSYAPKMRPSSTPTSVVVETQIFIIITRNKPYHNSFREQKKQFCCPLGLF